MQPLLQGSRCDLLSRSDFLIYVACDGLPAASLARLRRSCTECFAKVAHEHHIARLATERKLPGLDKLRKEGVFEIKTLHELYRAETPSLEAVLCIFGFASTEPHYDEESRNIMSHFVAILNEYPQLTLLVEGHGQPGAPEPLASDLAKQRAEVVSKEFQKCYSVSRRRIEITHRSNKCPRFADPEQNRRVELSLLDAKERTQKKHRFLLSF